MGYTSGAAMEDRGLRDIERWRDKIEVRLDNRQVFFLFFGSALVACMLFVLGVIVGKRLESRGRALSPEVEDPLTLLDKVATSPRPAQIGVTFPQALFGSGSKGLSTDKHGKRAALLPANAIVHEDPPAKPSALPLPVTSPATVGAKGGGPAEMSPVKASEKTQNRLAMNATSAAKPEEKKAPGANAAEEKDPKPVVIPTIAANSDSKSKAHFTLQLSSFQDKNEAEAFARKFEGERPYLVLSEIPGKGTWYRVRVGDYSTAKDAVTAKQLFERKHSVIAYVAQR